MRSVLKRLSFLRAWLVNGVCCSVLAGAAILLLENDQQLGHSVAADQTEMSIPEGVQFSIPSEPVENITASDGDTTESASSLASMTDEEAMKFKIELLEKGRAYLDSIESYSATFMKQERINGAMSDLQRIKLKLRHAPFSVYMKWLNCDAGRELLFVDGQNEDRMLVHVGGWQAKLLPVMKLDPNGSIALRESRHPVTNIGMAKLADIMLGHHERDLSNGRAFRCQCLEGAHFDNRDCYCFITEYDQPCEDSVYRRSIVMIDRELNIPLCVKNFAFPHDGQATNDEQTLIEYYGFADVRMESGVGRMAFNEANRDYLFVR